VKTIWARQKTNYGNFLAGNKHIYWNRCFKMEIGNVKELPVFGGVTRVISTKNRTGTSSAVWAQPLQTLITALTGHRNKVNVEPFAFLKPHKNAFFAGLFLKVPGVHLSIPRPIKGCGNS
jgi:hypothetical protein